MKIKLNEKPFKATIYTLAVAVMIIVLAILTKGFFLFVVLIATMLGLATLLIYTLWNLHYHGDDFYW